MLDRSFMECWSLDFEDAAFVEGFNLDRRATGQETRSAIVGPTEVRVAPDSEIETLARHQVARLTDEAANLARKSPTASQPADATREVLSLLIQHDIPDKQRPALQAPPSSLFPEDSAVSPEARAPIA